MALIVGNIRLPLEDSDGAALRVALNQLSLSGSDVKKIYIVKSSPDLRHRSNPCLVYSVGIELGSEKAEEAAVATAASQSVTLRKRAAFAPQPGTQLLAGRPVIAGFGPAGMFAGLLLSRAGYRPLIIERGADVDTRVRDVEGFWSTGNLNPSSNVQFGEGGAGTFSDGKLVTRINDPLCETVLNEFVKHGAPQSVVRLAKPHIGTDKLRQVVKSIRESILQNGGEIRFMTKLTDIEIKDGVLRCVTLSGCGEVETGALILSIGHSARDTFEMLIKAGVRLEPKSFSVGVRIEHLQADIDRGLYGALAGHPRLPRGEYRFSLRQGGRAAYTFCMCPGGTVVAAASEEGHVVTNGMSYSARDGRNANSALAVSVEAFSAPLEGVAFQRRLEAAAYVAGGGNYKAPFQTVGAFFDGSADFKTGRVRPTYPVGVTPARLDRLLPEDVTKMLKEGIAAFDKKLAGFAASDALLTGVETRTSSPVRIKRTGSYEAEGVEGLYPAGEGAGYAGGIVSAAVDGMRAAGSIIERFAPPK